MNEAIKVFGGITVKDIVLYMTALYWVFRVGKSWYKSMTDFHDKQQETESAVKLAKENRDIIDSISQKLDNLIQSDREYKLRSLGDKLFVCYNQGVLQGNTITRRQLENYERNEKLYLALGGNGIVKDKYHPEIMDMRVVEELPAKDVLQSKTGEHWAEVYYKALTKSMSIHERRFDENISRGESMALIARALGCPK